MPDTTKLNHDEVLEAARESMFGLSNIGYCTACGEQADGCEPDAEKHTCESCDEPAVYGASQLLYFM